MWSQAQEVVISTGSGSSALGELRRKVEQDQVRLAALSPGSAAHRQLRRRVLRSASTLHEQERRARQRAGHVRDLRLLGIVVGGGLTFAGWGAWPEALIGPAFAALFYWLVDRLPDHLYR